MIGKPKSDATTSAAFWGMRLMLRQVPSRTGVKDLSVTFDGATGGWLRPSSACGQLAIGRARIVALDTMPVAADWQRLLLDQARSVDIAPVAEASGCRGA